MEWLSSLMSGGVEGIGKGISEMAQGVRKAIMGPELSAEDKAKIEMQLLAMDQGAQKMAAEYESMLAKGQIDLNLLDAQSNDKFRSWPRPSVIWMCVFGFFYCFILRPLLPWSLNVAGLILSAWGYQVVPIPELPPLETEVLLTMAGCLLGLGGYRTMEKIKGLKK